MHPEKFRNPNKDRASVVEGSSGKQKPTKSVDIDEVRKMRVNFDLIWRS